MAYVLNTSVDQLHEHQLKTIQASRQSTKTFALSRSVQIRKLHQYVGMTFKTLSVQLVACCLAPINKNQRKI